MCRCRTSGTFAASRVAPQGTSTILAAFGLGPLPQERPNFSARPGYTGTRVSEPAHQGDGATRLALGVRMRLRKRAVRALESARRQTGPQGRSGHHAGKEERHAFDDGLTEGPDKRFG